MTSTNPGPRTPEAADARFAELNGDKSVIPPGSCCYTHTGEMNDQGMPKISLCPYWARDPKHPSQENGYCALLKEGDWDSEGSTLLWEHCKECGIKDEDEDGFSD